MKKLLVIFVLALFAWNIEVSHAQKPGIVLSDEPGWTHIGETVASFKSQNESIMVIGADEFSAIKIKVEDAPLQIDRLQVFYGSGEMEEIDVKKRIEAGQESEVFRLENPNSSIQKVAFTYNTVANAEGEKADVELYGLKRQDDKPSEAYRDDAERVDEAADDAARETEQATDNIEQETGEAAEDVEEAAENTGDDIERATEDAADDVERSAEETGDDLEEGAEKTESDLERAAEATGDAIAETAAKGAAEITDKRHDTKVGPDGQTIYVENETRYYYVNDQGKRVFVSEWQLKDKPDKD